MQEGQHLRNVKRRNLMITGIVLTLLVTVSSVFLLMRNSSITSPFNVQTISSVTYPLYYPTWLPQGYQIDGNSITIPQSGVVVFEIVGPNNTKLYVSEEARPTTFNFGGYYHNFTDLREHTTNSGTIAVGYINKQRSAVASLVIGKTWVLLNTHAGILSPDRLYDILKSLSVAH